MQNLLCNNVILVFSTSPEVSKIRNFLTTILQCGLRNDFFFQFQFTFSNFYLDFYFLFLSGLLFPFSLWTFVSLFSLRSHFGFLPIFYKIVIIFHNKLTFEILERKQKCTSDWVLFEVLSQFPI